MKDRVYFLDRLRVLSCFMVIMIHVSSYNWKIADIYGNNFMAMNIYDSLARFSAPVFVMISGYIFLNRDIDYKTLIKKHALKLLIAFLLFLGLYYFLLPLIAGDRLNNSVSYKHLWFLIMMIIMYLITPILKKIVEDINIERLFLIFFIIFRILLTSGEVYLNDLGIYTLSSLVSKTIEFFGTVNVVNFFDYTFYFILGHYLSKIKIDKGKRIIIYILGIAGLLLTIFMTKHISFYNGIATDTYYQNFMINTVLVSVSVFVLFQYNFNSKCSKLLLDLSKASFGVYLIHIFIIHLVAYFGLNTLSFNPYLSVPLISLIVFIIANLIVILYIKVTFKVTFKKSK